MVEFAPLLLRLVTVIVLVVGASLAAERAGPFWGAIIGTLPVAVGPTYVLLAMDHDAAFVSASALGTLASHVGLAAFLLAYITLAARGAHMIACLAAALSAWLALSLLARLPFWALDAAIVANVLAYSVTIYATRKPATFIPPRAGPSRAFELPLRALLVGVMVVSVVTLSAAMGPSFTGIVGSAPVTMTSLALILHPRLGGKGVAAVMAAAVRALPGLGFGYVTLCIAPLHMPMSAALTLALVVTLLWPVVLILHRQRKLTSSANG